MTIKERLTIYQATRIPNRPKVTLRVVVDIRIPDYVEIDGYKILEKELVG